MLISGWTENVIGEQRGKKTQIKILLYCLQTSSGLPTSMYRICVFGEEICGKIRRYTSSQNNI